MSKSTEAEITTVVSLWYFLRNIDQPILSLCCAHFEIFTTLRSTFHTLNGCIGSHYLHIKLPLTTFDSQKATLRSQRCGLLSQKSLRWHAIWICVENRHRQFVNTWSCSDAIHDPVIFVITVYVIAYRLYDAEKLPKPTMTIQTSPILSRERSC